MLRVTDLRGLPGLPSTLFGVRKWLAAKAVPSSLDGKRFVFALSSLPQEVQRAWHVRQTEATGLPPGELDDAAHTKLEARAPGIRDEAARRARIMAVVVRHRMAGRTWQEVFASIPVETGFEAPCEGTLINWSKMIDGVDPVNWAPALAPDWRQDGRPKAPCDPEAWDYFEKAIAASGRNGTGPSLRKAHGKAKAEAARQGWTFPNYRTALRHWERLPAERRRVLQTGADAAAKSLTLFQPRTLDGLAAMEQAEVDFREFPVLCIWEDGKIGCPWVGIATDRASSKIVGRSVARSENEEGVIALTRNMVETHGIPGQLLRRREHHSLATDRVGQVRKLGAASACG